MYSQPAARPAATIKDVARAAGVSVSTVSHVLTGKRSISPATSRPRDASPSPRAVIERRTSYATRRHPSGRRRRTPLLPNGELRSQEGSVGLRDSPLRGNEQAWLDAGLDDRSVRAALHLVGRDTRAVGHGLDEVSASIVQPDTVVGRE